MLETTGLSALARLGAVLGKVAGEELVGVCAISNRGLARSIDLGCGENNGMLPKYKGAVTELLVPRAGEC